MELCDIMVVFLPQGCRPFVFTKINPLSRQRAAPHGGIRLPSHTLNAAGFVFIELPPLIRRHEVSLASRRAM